MVVARYGQRGPGPPHKFQNIVYIKENVDEFSNSLKFSKFKLKID
jgi:hypothetical protein